MPAASQAATRVLQEPAHLVHHVGIARRLLHGPWRTLHVHQAHGRIRFSHRVQGAGRSQCHHVVDHRRPGSQRRAHHLGLHRVDRHHAATAGQRLDHRQHATNFFVNWHRGRARAGGLATDIEDIGARFLQLERMADGRLRIGQTPAVRKRIRRDIDDAHDKRAGQRESVRTGVENGHKNRGAKAPPL
jgi:hypothetical protein